MALLCGLPRGVRRGGVAFFMVDGGLSYMALATDWGLPELKLQSNAETIGFTLLKHDV